MPDLSLADELSELIASSGLRPLLPERLEKFSLFYDLFVRWNGRTNLSSIRDREGILRRHFLESIVCAQNLPDNLGTLLDFGSGGGFPGIPIALCRADISVTLAESQGKKAAFLQEAVRSLGLRVLVHAGRAEALPQKFDCVSMRAVDHMESAVHVAASLVAPGGVLALMTTEAERGLLLGSISNCFQQLSVCPITRATDKILVLARSTACPS